MMSVSRMPSAPSSRAERAFNSRTMAWKRRVWRQLRIACVIGVASLQREAFWPLTQILPVNRFPRIATQKQTGFVRRRFCCFSSWRARASPILTPTLEIEGLRLHQAMPRRAATGHSLNASCTVERLSPRGTDPRRPARLFCRGKVVAQTGRLLSTPMLSNLQARPRGWQYEGRSRPCGLKISSEMSVS